MELKRATKSKSKLKVGLAGSSGSGKTYSALLLARGIASSWDKIAVIDTENGSADLYAGLGEYNTLTLTAPFTPERYIEAIGSCEKAGMEVIVIDSITHEWDGTGGCLEIVDQLGGRFQDWKKVTPRHNKFIQAILQSTCHVITTVRRKQDYAVDSVEGKARVTKLGMKEITREGFEYELTLSFDLNLNHLAVASKDRTGVFMDKPEFIITQETGKTLRRWAEDGKQPLPVKQSPIQTPTRAVEVTEPKETENNNIAKTLEDLFGEDEVKKGLANITEDKAIRGKGNLKDTVGKSYCTQCGAVISMKVEEFSTQKHGRALCYSCQRIVV